MKSKYIYRVVKLNYTPPKRNLFSFEKFSGYVETYEFYFNNLFIVYKFNCSFKIFKKLAFC